jgi:dephospho-CoA kinase
MKSIALTGGIGCGKSTVAAALRGRKVPVVDSDDLAREVVQPGQPALDEIRAAFSPQAVSPEGELKRDELARIVFNDSDARKKLEAITHPRIRQLWEQQFAAWRSQGERFAVVVIPLLYEVGLETGFDEVVCVACSAVSQRERLQARGWSTEECRGRLAAQLPVEEKIARAHHVIWTEGKLEATTSQLDRLFAD